jgi:hypothetical protein
MHRRSTKSARPPVAAHALLEDLEPRQLLVFSPTADEQYMLELLNRMRINPAAELGKLTSSLSNPARSADPDVDAALVYFHTKGTVLAQQWASLVPAQPLAWSSLLYNSAEGHDNYMIAGDVQSHQVINPALGLNEPDLGMRANNAGYTGWSNLAENIFAYAESVFHAHAGFAIDWGGDPTDASTTGIQDPPGHRDDMMDPTYAEVGIRILSHPVQHTNGVGPLVVTQDFGKRFAQGQPFLLGVVYGDSSHDNFYEPGEGYGGVTVTAVSDNGLGSSFVTTSMSAGGWQLQVPVGTYAVTFSGGGFGNAVTYHNVIVNSQNTKLDAIKGVPPPAPIIVVLGNNINIAAGDVAPARADNTDFANANLDNQAIAKTFIIKNTGNQTLSLTTFPRIQITGLNASDFTLTMDAVSTIAPGATTSFTILFDPSALGQRVASVTIATNDPSHAIFTFAIQGFGIKRPILQVTGHQVVIANGDSQATTADWSKFAGIDAKFGTKTRVFAINNVGLKALNLGASAVTITGPNANRFQVILQPPLGAVNPGSLVQFFVRFLPGGAVGFANATINIASDDPVTPSYTFAIQGNGLALPRAQIASSTGVAIDPGSNNPNSTDLTDFASVASDGAGGAVRVRLFTLTNTGLATLTLSGPNFVSIEGANAADFVISAQPGLTTLLPGQSTTFKVRFDPTTTGLRTATVTLLTNENPVLSPSAGDYTFTIAGTGV